MAKEHDVDLSEAELCERRGDYADAMRHMKIVRDHALPDDRAKWNLRLGDLALLANDISLAREHFHAVVDAYATRGFYLRAVVVLNNRVIKRSCRDDRELAEAHAQLAEMYLKLGLLSKVVEMSVVVKGITTRNPTADPDGRMRTHAESVIARFSQDSATEQTKTGPNASGPVSSCSYVAR